MQCRPFLALGEPCWGNPSPHLPQALVAAPWGQGCSYPPSQSIETLTSIDQRQYPPHVGASVGHRGRALEAPGSLEMASVPKRSRGTRWTPLFISKTELGRRAPAHRGQGQLPGQVQHCPPLGLELEAGARAKGWSQGAITEDCRPAAPGQVPQAPEAARGPGTSGDEQQRLYHSRTLSRTGDTIPRQGSQTIGGRD